MASEAVSAVRTAPLPDAGGELVNRIASSHHLKSSPRLRELLFYIAKCAIREAPEDATERQIGIRVFGRHPGYNSSDDSIVRTHARLLRQKLAAYSAEDGSAEEIVMDAPMGHYLPVFHALVALALGTTEAPPALPLPVAVPEATPARPPRRAFLWRNWIIAAAFLPVLAAAAILFLRPWHGSAPAETAVDLFWRPFLSAEPPLVFFW